MDASTDKYIQIGRAAAWSAFGYIRAPEESPLAYFNGAQRADAPRATKAKPRTHVTHAKATRNSGTSKAPLVDAQGLDGWKRRAISDMEPLQRMWVEFFYRQPGVTKAERRQSFYRAFSDRYTNEHLDGKKHGTRRRVRQLVDFAIDNRRGFPDLAGYDLKPDNWRKTYLPHLRKIREEIAQIDADAMYSLGLIVEQEGRE